MKILMIDDDSDLLGMMARRFSRRGFEVVTAEILENAIQILSTQNDIEIIICDLFLKEGENGLNFFDSHISQKFKGKFILATGDEMADKRIAQYKKEIPQFFCIEKPYAMEKVFEIIESIS